MKDHSDDLARALSSEPEPSPALVGDVMRSVRREASAPPPLTFPWPLAVAAAAMTVALAAFASIVAGAPEPAAAVPLLWTALGGVASLLGAGAIRAAFEH